LIGDFLAVMVWGASSRVVLSLQAVHFEDCKGIRVRGITLQNSPQYHLTFTRSSGIEANYLRVTSPADSPNTKGVHLVDSYNVHVMDDLISTGIRQGLPFPAVLSSFSVQKTGFLIAF
jgi:polygalacturonase